MSYADRVCNGFKQLGARGISVIFSSGDAGVGTNGTCFSNTDPSKRMFIPNFPASCPWVTTVGATQGYEPEVVVQRFGSGAGFSNYFGRPAYQTSAVEGYFGKIGNLYSGLYNRSGRGYPDVAAQGNHDVIVWAGNVTTIGGTSASSPTFAAVIALVNDALIAAGKPALGFLNPWLYGNGSKALTDITSGSSIGCNTSGFPAEVGWDAATGFGTPVSRYPMLVKKTSCKKLTSIELWKTSRGCLEEVNVLCSRACLNRSPFRLRGTSNQKRLWSNNNCLYSHCIFTRLFLPSSSLSQAVTSQPVAYFCRISEDCPES